MGEETVKIVENMSEAEYHANPDKGATQLKLANISINHMLAQQEGDSFLDSKAAKLGTALHCAVLQPNLFKMDYLCAPGMDKRKKEYKEWAAEHAGKIVLDIADYEAVIAMRDSLRVHPFLAHRFGEKSKGRTEVSFFTEDSETGIGIKCRCDYLEECKEFMPEGDYAVIIDVKTTSGLATPEEVGKAMYNFGYDMQAGHYSDIVASVLDMDVKFYFAFVEKKAPFNCAVYELDPEDLEEGRRKCYEALDLINQYNNAKPEVKKKLAGYSQDVQVVSLPRWAKNK